MNIRVDLNYPIKDGTEVVFRSPVDCSRVTGLKVYHIGADGNTTSQEFMLADAHGNNVGDIDHLFAENVAVKVILDVTTSMAFVQNADTNAYLEGRFASLPIEITDKLCPSFTESGSVVSCEPVEGYPLEVVSTISPRTDGIARSKITMRNCGKNLLKFPYYMDSRTINGVTFTVNADGTVVANGTSTAAATFAFARDHGVEGLFLPLGKFTLSGCPAGGSHSTYRLACGGNGYGLDAYDIGAGATNSTKEARSCTSVTIQIMKAGVTLDNVVFRPQIEAGSVATAYEPPKGETYTVDLGSVTEGQYNWKTGVLTDADGNETQTTPHNVVAHSGTNILFSDCGSTSVSGKADPVSVIEKLTNAIIALGGNV